MTEGNQVLAMYDVRGIQNYIYKTNKIKEIIGASRIVENIVTDGLKAYADKQSDKCLLDWEDNEKSPWDAMEKDNSILMQVLFIGGGNAYVLFRNETECTNANKFLSKYVLEKTYSLQLAVAYVEKTNSYKDDYKKLNQKLSALKMRMNDAKPLGLQPFMAQDSLTGYPLTTKVYGADNSAKYISTERYLKLQAAKENSEDVKILDDMISEKGTKSVLAVAHIDGNNMGKRIKNIMQDRITYEEAIPVMREISLNVRSAFIKAYQAAEKKIADMMGKSGYSRKVILAGDDITFICNSDVAIKATEVFIKECMKYDMFVDGKLSANENHRVYGFSACAGIAFFNSHFPFSDAYMVAEECCDEGAKKYAKDRMHMEVCDGLERIGSYIDYQVCTHIKAADIELYRDKNYTIDGESVLFRPYYIKEQDDSCLNKNNIDKDIDILWNNLREFKKPENRGTAKMLRNAISIGKSEREKTKTFLESRKVILPKTPEKSWYDALEIMDICKVEEA